MTKGFKGFQKGHPPFEGTHKFQKGEKAHLGCKHSQESKEKMSKSAIGKHDGEQNGNWKGNKITYMGLHSWIIRKLGQPKHCAYCQTETAKKFEWANISHTYKRDFSDWIRLCTKCHHSYDRGKISLQ